MRGPLCATAALLPGVSGGRLAAHRERCLRCQADKARRRSLDRELAALGAEVAPAPATLHAAVMARLGPQDAADPRRGPAARAPARRRPPARGGARGGRAPGGRAGGMDPSPGPPEPSPPARRLPGRGGGRARPAAQRAGPGPRRPR